MKVLTHLGYSRRVLFLTVLVAMAACTKKTPKRALPPPAAVTPSGQPSTRPVPSQMDPASLNEFERKVFDQVVKSEPSACGKGQSLLDSSKLDPSCRASFYAVRYVARLAKAGHSAAEITEKLELRFRTPRVPDIDISAAPRKGAPSGRVTLVEFADYTCSHCKEAQALMPALLAAYPKEVSLYFKHYPLGGSVGGLNAALGAVGAQKQDKFWPFSDKVWENSEHISPAVLESIAKGIEGFDFDRWYKDLSTDEVRQHVIKDRNEARALRIQKTPAIFINGRLFTDEVDLAGLTDWIDEELGR